MKPSNWYLCLLLCLIVNITKAQSFTKDYFNTSYSHVTTCIINDYDSLNPIIGQDSIIFESAGPKNYGCITIEVKDSVFFMNDVDTASVIVDGRKVRIVNKGEICSGLIQMDFDNDIVVFQLVGDDKKYAYQIEVKNEGTILKRLNE
jgi:hypothetical protein